MRCEAILILVTAATLGSTTAYCQTAHPEETKVIEVPSYRSPDEKVPDLAAVTAGIIKRTNEFREKEKQPRVAADPKLMQTAKGFAEYMGSTDRYGHSADGSNPGERATKRGYEFGLISENIAYAFSSEGYETDGLAKQFVDGWEKSPGHRKNMLDPDVTQTGVGVARSEKTGYYFAVQMFGRPKSDSVKFEVENRTTATVSYKVLEQTFEIQPRYTQYHEMGRPSDVTFELKADGKPAPQTFKLEKKSRFILVDAGGTVKAQKE